MTRQEEEGGQSVEMRMSLPAMPSAYALALLFAACREIHRVGSHTLDRAVLRLFAWSVSQQVRPTRFQCRSTASVTLSSFSVFLIEVLGDHSSQTSEQTGRSRRLERFLAAAMFARTKSPLYRVPT